MYDYNNYVKDFNSAIIKTVNTYYLKIICVYSQRKPKENSLKQR